MRKSYILILFLYYSMTSYSQGFPVKFKSLDFEAGADCRIGLGKVVTGFSMTEFRFRSTLTLTQGIQVVGIFKSSTNFGYNWYDIKNRHNRVSQLYVQYSNAFNILNRNLVINAYAGRLEYYPIYKEPKFYFDNIGYFDFPPAYYGAQLKTYYNILKKGNLDFFMDVNSGDILGNTGYKAMLNEIYLSYTPEIFKGIYAQTKVGKYPGYLFVVNEAYLFYDHSFKLKNSISIKPLIEVGRLPSYDISPYGVRFGFQILTSYFLFGSYYEKRFTLFNFQEMHYLAVYFSVLKPKIVADILCNGAILYDPGSKSLRFKIPFNLHINL